MKILVLSDSHTSLQFMRRCVEAAKPDEIIHLGDYYDDGQVIAQENPHIPIHLVPGNCDRFRCPEHIHRMLCYPVGGVMLYMTHGHNENVKWSLESLVDRARRYGAQAALYGHTHEWDCHREDDGLWVLNPGSCGYGGGSAALLTIENERIAGCCRLTQEKLEEMV